MTSTSPIQTLIITLVAIVIGAYFLQSVGIEVIEKVHEVADLIAGAGQR